MRQEPIVIVRVQRQDFDMNEELERLRAGRHDIGAVVSFLGTVRDIHNGETVLSMELEHYPEMTENVLQDIAGEALKRWNILDVTIIHRVGKLKPSDRIVLIAVASSHRGEAFSACEYIIDTLKDRAPFWKKEETPNGAHWVRGR